MRKLIISLILGIFLGITFVKSEAVSWFRIQEMFYFKAFHMFGIIGLAAITSIIGVWLIKQYKIRSIDGSEVSLKKKPYQKGVIFGSLMFGIGWAFTGACPGPIYTLIGVGEPGIWLIVLGVFSGVFLYGITLKR
jgi:uncharacterized membrane protein YedE/YeeE